MNNCFFTGYLVEDPIQVTDPDGSIVCWMDLIVYEHVKTKRYETHISLAAYGSGAEQILRIGKAGHKMSVRATALDREASHIDFRVNKFDFAHITKD